MPRSAVPYRDDTRPVAERVADLLGRMTLADKAGLMFQPIRALGAGAAFHPDQPELLIERRISHVNLLGSGTPREMAEWHNRMQEAAADTPLGIPVTLASDPRHAFTDNPATAMRSGPFSQWPESLGLAALDDPALVTRYADTVRREYLAVGIRLALHPQLDLATEPRWARASGTFGEDAELTARLVGPYLRGLRGGETLGPASVSAMVKHFPGGGPQRDGEDPHFAYGREQVYPGGFFDYHLRPFRAAIAAGATQVMPYYGMPVGTGYPEVGFAFNRDVITGLLREQLGFTGIVCADWAVLTDQPILGDLYPARAWGVEHLTPIQRTRLAIEAGVDQFGGESCPEHVIELVHSGRLAEARIDGSAARLLTEKFRLGLFENPFVDPDAAEEIVGRGEFRAEGAAAQRRALTLLVNRSALPASAGTRLYVEGVDPALAGGYAPVVADRADADLAVLRLDAPYEVRAGAGRYEAGFHRGRLDFPPERLKEILDLLDAVPTIVAIHLDRPAVIPEIAERCAGLIAVFGASDAAVLDVVFGRARADGRLPFQLPRTMAEVLRGRPDTPQESPDPLFPFGAGFTGP